MCHISLMSKWRTLGWCAIAAISSLGRALPSNMTKALVKLNLLYLFNPFFSKINSSVPKVTLLWCWNSSIVQRLCGSSFHHTCKFFLWSASLQSKSLLFMRGYAKNEKEWSGPPLGRGHSLNLGGSQFHSPSGSAIKGLMRPWIYG